MSQLTMRVRVVFIDGEMISFDSVTQFGITDDNVAYYVARFGHKMFFNINQVKYIGRSFDLDNRQVGERE